MAGKPRAEYEIKAKDETKKGVSSAKSGLQDFGKTAKKAFGVAKIAAVAGAAAIAAVGAGMKKVTDAYAIQEKAELGLIAASNNNPFIDGTAVQGLLDSASALQKMSTYGDEALIPFMQLGVNMGHTEEQINQVSQAAVNLASATGGSLEGAFKQIYKTLQGTGGELNETVAGMRDLTAEELKAGKGLELLEEQFGGMAESMARSTAGIQEQFKNMWGDVMESAGKALAPLNRIMLEKMKGPLEAVGKWFEDNQKQITNFFLHFGEIARITMTHVKDSIMAAFAWDNVVKSAKAMWDYMKTSVVNFGKFSWGIMKAVAKTIWGPLSKGFEWVIYGVKVGWQAMINGLSKGINWLVENPIDSISMAFETVVHAIGNSIQWILNGIFGLINGVISGLDKIIEGAHNAQQFLAHPLDKSKREKYEGGELNKLGEMDIEWLDPKNHEKLTTNLLDFVDDVGAIPKPANEWEAIYNEIGSVWKETAGDSVDLWLDQFDALKELSGTLAEPFVDGFTGFTAKFTEVIERELPPEAQNLVKTMMTKLETSMTTGFAGSVSQMRGTGNRSWSALMKRITDSLKGLGTGFVTFGKNLWKKTKSATLDIIDAIKKPGESIKKLFTNISSGLAEAGHSFVDKLADLAENGLSDDTLQKLRDGFKFVGNGLIAIGKWMIDQVMNTEGIQEIVSMIQDSISNAFETLVAPIMENIMPLVQVLLTLTETVTSILIPAFEALGTLFEAITPIIDLLGQLLTAILVPVVGILAQVIKIVSDLLTQITPVIETIFEMLITVLAPILQFISDILTAIAPIFEMIGQVLIALMPIFEALGYLLSSILTPALEVIAEILQAVLVPVMTVLSQIMTVLTPIFQVFAAIMKSITPIFDVLFKLLSIVIIPLQLLSIILESLNPLFIILAWLIELLIPVIEIFAKIIDAVTRPIEFLGDILTWLGVALKAFGQALFYAVTFQWNKFGDIDWPGSFSSDAFKRPLIDISDTTPSTDLTTPTTDDLVTIPDTTSDTTSSGSGASYGGSNLTINVTINAEAVVGDPGLREFALMIDDEINSARKLGIA